MKRRRREKAVPKEEKRILYKRHFWIGNLYRAMMITIKVSQSYMCVCLSLNGVRIVLCFVDECSKQNAFLLNWPTTTHTYTFTMFFLFFFCRCLAFVQTLYHFWLSFRCDSLGAIGKEKKRWMLTCGVSFICTFRCSFFVFCCLLTISAQLCAWLLWVVGLRATCKIKDERRLRQM